MVLRVVLGDVKAKKGVVLCEDTLVSGAVAWNNLVGTFVFLCFSWLDAFVWSSHLLEGQGVDGRIALQHGPNFVPQTAAPAPDEVLHGSESAAEKFISWQAKQNPL